MSKAMRKAGEAPGIGGRGHDAREPGAATRTPRSSRLSRRSLLGVASTALPLASFGWARAAQATTARAVGLPELVSLSHHALAGTPTDAWCRWETVGKSRRIVTYHQVEITQTLDGRPPPEPTLLVRTLGGRVGDIGQLVHGEAHLTPEKPTVVFLTPDVDGLLGVTAMAQGHYPLRPVERDLPRLEASPNMPSLQQVEGCAVNRLVDTTVLEAEELIAMHLPAR